MENLNKEIEKQAEEMLDMFYSEENQITAERDIVFRAQENKGEDIIVLTETEKDDNSALFDALLKGK